MFSPEKKTPFALSWALNLSLLFKAYSHICHLTHTYIWSTDDGCPFPIVVVALPCCKSEKSAPPSHLIFFAGQAGQAYAQAALQYAYAPNMLAAQQLTAAGDHQRSHRHHARTYTYKYNLITRPCVSFKLQSEQRLQVLQCKYKYLICRPDQPWLPSRVCRRRRFEDNDYDNVDDDGDDGDNIDDVVDDGVGDDFDCDAPGPAPAGQATQQPQPAEQRIQ